MREQIIRATARIITREGSSGASTRAICNEVGIKAPTLYHYFSNKEDLLDTVIRSAFEKNDLYRESADSQKQSTLDKVKQCWDRYIEFVIHEPDLYAMMVASMVRGHIPEVGKTCYEKLKAKFHEMGEQGQLLKSPEESAAIYLSAAQGVAALYLAKATPEMLLQVAASTREIVLRGLLKNQ